MNSIPGNCCLTSYQFKHFLSIGQGSQSQVFKTQNIVDDYWYVVKRIALPQIGNSEKSISAEARLLVRLDHKHVLRYYAAWIETNCPTSQFDLLGDPQLQFDLPGDPQSTRYLYIKTEFCEKGTISKLIDEGLGKDLNHRQRLARELAEGMRYLHENKVTHGDLHAGNVFLDSNDRIKIGDLGLGLKHLEEESAGEKFEIRRIEDIRSLKKLVIELLVPFARNPTNGSETYGKDKRNFIKQDIEAPDFDQALRNHILQLRALIDAEDEHLTAQGVLDILHHTFIDNNNNTSTPMQVEKPEEAQSNNETSTKQPIGTPMDVEGPENTKGVREASETFAKEDGKWLGWFTAGFSTFSLVLWAVLIPIIVILFALVFWGVKTIRQKDVLIRKLALMCDPILKSIAVSASV